MARKENPEPNLMPNVLINPQDLFADVSTQEEALAKIGILLADETRKKMMSEIPDEEMVKILAVLVALAKRFNIKFIEEVVDNYLLMNISKYRKGRKEITDIVKGGSERIAGSWRDKLQRLLPPFSSG